MIRFAGLATLPAVCLCFLVPPPLGAQSGMFFRLAPEASRLSAEHSKRVTVGDGSSESATASSALTFGANASIGVRTRLRGALTAGAELEGIVAGRRKIEGTIRPTRSGEPHDVWPGAWDFSDRFGIGGNVLVGLDLGDGGVQGYAFGGIRRMWSEFATSGVNPDTGEVGERRERRARWPSTIGVGLTLRSRWPMDIRVGYSSSRTEWSVQIPDVLLDYGYSASGITISAGIGLTR